MKHRAVLVCALILVCGTAHSQGNQIIIEKTKASAVQGTVYEGSMLGAERISP